MANNPKKTDEQIRSEFDRECLKQERIILGFVGIIGAIVVLLGIFVK